MMIDIMNMFQLYFPDGLIDKGGAPCTAIFSSKIVYVFSSANVKSNV